MRPIQPSLIPLIYKKTARYTGSKRPEPGECCIFSPGILLTSSSVAPKAKGEFPATCRVIGNRLHLVEIQFEGFDRSDYTDPVFLMKAELTEFGKSFVASAKST